MVGLDITYFAKNWKHCSKIIFKYVNSVVNFIFNENFVEKRGLWVPWTMHRTHWKSWNTLLTKKKKKKKKGQMQDVDAIQTSSKSQT